MKKATKKLVVRREAIANLTPAELRHAVGGNSVFGGCGTSTKLPVGPNPEDAPVLKNSFIHACTT
jgi:hypothetical protein